MMGNTELREAGTQGGRAEEGTRSSEGQGHSVTHPASKFSLAPPKFSKNSLRTWVRKLKRWMC